MFEIRPAEEKDCELVLNFIKKLADYEKLLDQVTATVDDVRRELFGESVTAHAEIAYEDDTPVGFALYFHNFSTFLTRKGLYLEDIFIDPAYRAKGYGKALMRYLAALAVKEKCGRFEWVVLEWNTPAIGFYEKVGATVLPDWRLCRLTGEALERFAKGS